MGTKKRGAFLQTEERGNVMEIEMARETIIETEMERGAIMATEKERVPSWG